jgi:hypothetical protein
MPAETTRPCQKALAKALAHLCAASKRRSPNQTKRPRTWVLSAGAWPTATPCAACCVQRARQAQRTVPSSSGLLGLPCTGSVYGRTHVAISSNGARQRGSAYGFTGAVQPSGRGPAARKKPGRGKVGRWPTLQPARVRARRESSQSVDPGSRRQCPYRRGQGRLRGDSPCQRKRGSVAVGPPASSSSMYRVSANWLSQPVGGDRLRSAACF